MIGGFTGTQIGMTHQQKYNFEKLLVDLGIIELHHGDCVGADADAHSVAFHLNLRLVLHPPIKTIKRAFCHGAHEVLPAKDYLARNHDIVDVSHVMFATPKGPEELRSGTWSTIRYAWRIRKDTYVIWPDGSVDFHQFFPTQLVDF